MTRVTFVGDPHGDTAYISLACEQAERDDADALILLGDNGMHSGFYQQLGFDAKTWDIDILFIPGNHDHWDYLDSLGKPKQVTRSYGMFQGCKVTDRVWYLPPATVGVFGGKRFVFLGGADSIDKGWRIESDLNMSNNDPNFHRSWWPQEMVSEDDVALAKARGYADVFVTHDSGDFYRHNGEIHTDIMSWLNRTRIGEVARVLRPRLHVHGHWHRYYTKDFQFPFDKGGNMGWWEYDVVGFDCNYNGFGYESFRTYDTETGWV